MPHPQVRGASRRWDSANTGCGSVLLGRVESQVIPPPSSRLVLLLFELFPSIDNPPKNTPWLRVEALLNADCAVEEIAFEIDSAEDEYEVEQECSWDDMRECCAGVVSLERALVDGMQSIESR